MKNSIVIFCLLILTLLFLSGCRHEEPTIEAKLVRSAVGKIAKTLEQRYQLHFMGIAESGGKGYYRLVGLRFNVDRILSKEEGRKIVVDSTEYLLNEINSNIELQSYLKPYPFTQANVEMVIFVDNPDRTKVYYPDIAIFSTGLNRVAYKTKVEDQEYGYYTDEKESYEQALNIVRSQP